MSAGGTKIPTDSGQGSGAKVIKVSIKFSGRSIPVEIPADSTVRTLKSALQPLTNVLTRGQKLIFKGKVLPDEMTLESSKITNGAKIMLMATQGLHQGDGPIKREVPVKTIQGNSEDDDVPVKVPVHNIQLDRWKATGVIALSDCNIKVIPEEIWPCGPSARHVDLSSNLIDEVPEKISCLSSIRKLLLHANELEDESLSWKGLASLKYLTMLTLNNNRLSELSPTVGDLKSLQQLHVGNNQLTTLPPELSSLLKLQVLKANNNRIKRIGDSISGCTSLVEVDLHSNLLVELPESLGNLKELKALYLSHNGLRSLPSTLFKKCIHLSILDLHGTDVTNDVLRELEGWEEFDSRRRLKHQKQLDFRVSSAAEFDEGADKN